MDHSIRTAEIVGPSGTVYGFDKWSGVENTLSQKSGLRGLKNILAQKLGITGLLLVNADSIDVCWLATVLHILDVLKKKDIIF